MQHIHTYTHPVVTLYLFALWFFPVPLPFRSMNLRYARDENVFFLKKELAKFALSTLTHRRTSRKRIAVVIIIVVVVFLFFSRWTPGVNRKTIFFCVFLLFFFSISHVIVIPSNWHCLSALFYVCRRRKKKQNFPRTVKDK